MLYLKTCKQRCTTWLPLELTLSASTDSDNKVIKRCLSVVPETSNKTGNSIRGACVRTINTPTRKTKKRTKQVYVRLPSYGDPNVVWMHWPLVK
jgi:hypothetical protein